eukprot:CAMPEP_0170969372 /NCGR_PEP_ID=MMETSP0735-20130129/43926_1 /TAXON_ID=186038 /ORGANISM="Fragilariopsis kerguelensis, Strain L26-C5" /LENGTH=102 /DNA_ID=CAMNT_0011388803 /DNA_START=692 /DNA_END=1000 /DNA_ORIENTATION=-
MVPDSMHDLYACLAFLKATSWSHFPAADDALPSDPSSTPMALVKSIFVLPTFPIFFKNAIALLSSSFFVLALTDVDVDVFDEAEVIIFDTEVIPGGIMKAVL